MSSIDVRLLQSPAVLKDGEQVVFPFRKAEALFYYILVKGQATRDELVDLLWGEEDEETARKNLRHAMYKIRKAFDVDIIVSPQKSIVMLNPEIEVTTDLQAFLRDGGTAVDAYNGEFLQGFLLKEGEKFEEWMFRTREHCRDLYLSKLYEKIDECQRKNEPKKIEYYGKLLLDEDPFDERPYRVLMESCGSLGAYHKVIGLYNRLEEMLMRELGIMPDPETKRVYEAVLAKRKLEEMSKGKEKSKGFFYGRSAELETMKAQYAGFSNGHNGRSVLLVGEAGIGKTRLKDRFLELVAGDALFVLQANCYQAEENYPLKPWNQIFSQLAEILPAKGIEVPQFWKNIIVKLFPIFDPEEAPAAVNPVERIDRVKYRLAEDAVLEILKRVSKERKLLLVIEDLHWMDGMSLRLLSFILRNLGGSGVLLVATCRNSYDKRIDEFVAALDREQLLEKIRLVRFTKGEVAEFIEQVLPQHAMTVETKERIYRETEGNAFFLAELLNTVKEKGTIGEISGKAQDILKSRIIDISEDGMKLLYIVSLFFDRVDLELLLAISGKDELELLDALEELQKKYIIREYELDDEICFEFTHHKLREFIYGLQSPARKKILHNRVGQVLEKRLKNDYSDKFIYSRLIYHFTNGGNKLAALKYRIKNLDDYSDFSHELFPVLDDEKMPEEKYVCLNQEESLKHLKDLEEQLMEVKKSGNGWEEIAKLEIAFYHTKGRYCIQEGEYQQGVDAIQKMIEGAEQAGDFAYMLKGYRQMIYYGIQVHNADVMQEYLTKGLLLAEVQHQIKERGILLRLQGLQKLMSESYDEAEETLKQSIHIFEALNKQEDRYALNIAAAYNYMGEIRRYNMKFSSALHFYDKAMEICDEKKVFRGMTLFNTNAGLAAFDMGDYSRAQGYFAKAIKHYQQMDALLGRSTAEGYMALLLVREDKYQEALESLKRAEEYANRLKSPYEMGLIYRMKAEIKGRMANNPDLDKAFGAYLPLTIKDYCDRGIELLSGLKNCYETEILKVLRRDKG